MEEKELNELLRAKRESREAAAKQRKLDDAEDRQIAQYKLDHEAKMLAGLHALDSIGQRAQVAAARPADDKRFAEKNAPACLRDAIERIDREIKFRREAGVTGKTSLHLGGLGSVRQLTPAEEVAVQRAEAAKLKLENLYIVEVERGPLIAKIFDDQRSGDAAADLEILLRPSAPTKAARPPGAPADLELAVDSRGGMAIG